MAARGSTVLAWDHWHIEAASICTLKCPRCPRAEVPETLLNRQLDLAFFQNQIGASIVKQIRKITFCGNDGDPIYCRDFLDICGWLKQVNQELNLVIITNGSYRSTEWWHKLAKILDHGDEIHWSLDGWDQHSNSQYRINCDWDSISSGIETFAAHNSQTYRVWAAIAFSFNQHKLHEQQQLAKRWLFDAYQLTKSTKFGSRYPGAYGQDDALEPTNKELVSSGDRFERSITTLSSKPRPGQELRQIFLSRAKDIAKQQYSGICLIGNKGVFLNSQGEFYPCCWTANRYAHNAAWHKLAQSRFNLHTTTFEQILKDTFWTEDFLKFNSLECTTKCTPQRLADPAHSTEW